MKCRHCNGEGLDPYTDYLLECERCEGSGWVVPSRLPRVSVPGAPAQPETQEVEK